VYTVQGVGEYWLFLARKREFGYGFQVWVLGLAKF
jgi:hypothetical protein